MHESKYLTAAIVYYIIALILVWRALSMVEDIRTHHDSFALVAVGLCFLASVVVVCGSFFMYKYIQASKK
jgi:hypothetical protein